MRTEVMAPSLGTIAELGKSNLAFFRGGGILAGVDPWPTFQVHDDGTDPSEYSSTGPGLGAAPDAGDVFPDARPGGPTGPGRQAAVLHHGQPALRHADRPRPAAAGGERAGGVCR